MNDRLNVRFVLVRVWDEADFCYHEYMICEPIDGNDVNSLYHHPPLCYVARHWHYRDPPRHNPIVFQREGEHPR